MFDGLNEEQTTAVHHVEGPMLVLAGAGTGKTRVVTLRISYLLSLGVQPSEILAVTFTNKAAEEMRERVQRLTKKNILTCTFHSFGAKLLRSSIEHLGYSRRFTIYDEKDSEEILKESVLEAGVSPEKGVIKEVRAKISQAKNDLLSPEEIDPREDDLLRRCYLSYQKKLKENQAVDFDDLLFLTVKIFREYPDILQMYQNTWKFLLIDEYQDTNSAQDQLIKLLAAPRNNIFAVGDPDQSIYSWRGARIQNILNFSRQFPNAVMVTLQENYRSKSTILRAANGLIRHNPVRYEKDLWSSRGDGELITLCFAEDDRTEARFVVKKILDFQSRSGSSFNHCAIFYRTNAQSRIFEDALLQQRIPYVIVGGLSFYDRKEIKDILCFLRMIDTGSDLLSFMRTIKIPKRGIGDSAIEKIRSAIPGMAIFAGCEAIVSRRISVKLSPRQFAGLEEYVELIRSMRYAFDGKIPLHEGISLLIEKSKYLSYLREDMESYQDRKENVAELVTKAVQWSAEMHHNDLSLFLEELSLKSSLDEQENREDALRLMTLHNSKGLEFDFVALVGMEEELFPHINSLDNRDSVEEERRLCYVGMTRAKDELCLSTVRNRLLWGTWHTMRPSRFLSEIPSQYVKTVKIRS
jgi:DNA helicase-2/ATP-dependent DNA helicase PcrA